MKDIAVDHGNTSNTTQHLKNKHKSKFDNLKKNMKKAKMNDKLDKTYLFTYQLN